MGIPVWSRLKGSPMKIIQASCMAALTLCLAGAALADDLQTVGDPDSLGFSARRLACHWRVFGFYLSWAWPDYRKWPLFPISA